MKIFKFGGASLKNASAIFNLKEIIERFGGPGLVVVVSAMGKTTNALESIFKKARGNNDYQPELNNLINFHLEIGNQILRSEESAKKILLPVFDQLIKNIEDSKMGSTFDESYDRIIPFGELISSALVHKFLASNGMDIKYLDARDLIITDEKFREAEINWEVTCQNILKSINQSEISPYFLTQGFIGRSLAGKMTTLGREGSDFTAAIFAQCLNADSVTIWKDVPGILNADPKRMSEVQLFKELSYQESAEMSYYGASVLHPRTIKPLANSKIPLYVKSFEQPSLEGTRINSMEAHNLPPAYIFKDDQCIISFTRRDLEFINEKNLGEIFYALDHLKIKINLMQNSAVSFTICINQDHHKTLKLIDLLSEPFKILYNEELQLITIKNQNPESILKVSENKEVLLEQRTRNTYQVIIRNAQS